MCHNLWNYAHGGQARPTDGEIVAVHIVAHETMHINGITSEAVAECRAVQLNHLVAEALGATPDEARALQRRYFVDFYPHQQADYVSQELRRGRRTRSLSGPNRVPVAVAGRDGWLSSGEGRTQTVNSACVYPLRR